MSKSMITDPRVKLRPTLELLRLINQHMDSIEEVTANIAKALKCSGFVVPDHIEISKNEEDMQAPKIDLDLLTELCNNSEEGNQKDCQTKESNKEEDTNSSKQDARDIYLYLNDLRWLNTFLAKLRKEKGSKTFLHNLIESSALELPENEIIPRNPKLEARCQRLREEQQNRDYRKMTKDVDAGLKNHPEDTIAYQMKALNAQIIAVLQFVFSVVAGFVFGFLGIELIIGNLDFGLRLLLGIMFALIIALAEIYFLAKKLNEYDDIGDTSTYPITPAQVPSKPHLD